MSKFFSHGIGVKGAFDVKQMISKLSDVLLKGRKTKEEVSWLLVSLF